MLVWRGLINGAAVAADGSGAIAGPALEKHGVDSVSLESISNWVASPSHLPEQSSLPSESAIDLWLAPIGLTGALLGLPDVLTDSDRRIAQHHRHAAARDQWLARRTLLRIALFVAMRGRIPPQAWQFQVGALGKPTIAPEFPQVSFSLSQNHVVSAVAVSANASVGIDVECLDQPIDDYVIACFTSPRERAALSLKRPAERRQEFLKLWTLKEAYAKMLGLGLSADFARLEFSIDPLRFFGEDPVGIMTWAMTFDARPCQVSLAARFGTLTSRTSQSFSRASQAWYEVEDSNCDRK